MRAAGKGRGVSCGGAGSVQEVSPETRMDGHDGRKCSQGRSDPRLAQGRACWEPWVLRLQWHLFIRGAASRMLAEGSQHVSWYFDYFLPARMGCQNRQKATDLAWPLCRKEADL